MMKVPRVAGIRSLCGWLLAGLVAATGPAAAPTKAPDEASEKFLRQGLELLLTNEYPAAKRLFKAEILRRPDEALPHVALLMLYQLQMYELDDFAHEREFDRTGAKALELTRKTMRRRSLAWDATLEAAVYGMQGLQQARKEHWLAAARLGLKAKNALDQALKLDPELADACLGLGVYRYYASILTKKYWFLPGFGDQRAEGLADVLRAREKGLYLNDVAELALLYIYYEEKRYTEALELAQRVARRWPANALGQSWVGWMQLKLGRTSSAVETFSRVCAGGEKRFHCLYHIGVSRMLDGQDPELGLATFQAFLQTEPSNWWRSRAYYRIGMAQLRLGRTSAARMALRAACYIDPAYALPRQRLELLQREAASGTKTPRSSSAGTPVPLARWNDP